MIKYFSFGVVTVPMLIGIGMGLEFWDGILVMFLITYPLIGLYFSFDKDNAIKKSLFFAFGSLALILICWVISRFNPKGLGIVYFLSVPILSCVIFTVVIVFVKKLVKKDFN